ncbi:hypothetical protein EDI_344710 [Entamoeba dispar SAW760]|uniref:Uncharacterized protein n=1 Tax=Entamoeba dispar (strain ATCC PRA-260 / SAW760) TaxID=370354 RepID=B0EDY6_ENTDS|nr:uncharacterized protein EDI_344710 [Entamoeba dispar SAW760]EDR27265.1 hypothetical protein EDI_344710 [Entamoeba dispar SAW760]|eukprot:EDR27265.1 hypothetical protein EDI_344710 [Entamoeba dispar SAW760]
MTDNQSIEMDSETSISDYIDQQKMYKKLPKNLTNPNSKELKSNLQNGQEVGHIVTLSEPPDIFQEYLDNLQVTYENFENYEKTETKEIMKEIHATNKKKACMIIFLILGICFPPFLICSLVYMRKYRKSQKLSSIYHITLFIVFVDIMLLLMVVIAALFYAIKSL